jgi:hypothetical protein
VRDIARFSDIHFNPYWSFTTQNVFTWQKNNLQGFVFEGKIDWVQARGLFVYGALIGIRISSLASADSGFGWQSYPAGGPAGYYTGVDTDYCLWPLYIEGSSNPPFNRFDNSLFNSIMDGHTGDGDAGKGSIIGVAVRIRPNTDGLFQFSNCQFGAGSFYTHAFEVDSPLAVTLQVNNSNFVGWDKDSTGAAAVEVISSGASGGPKAILNFTGNNFRTDKAQINLNGGRITGVFTGNTFAGTKRITSTSTLFYTDVNNTSYDNGNRITFTNGDTTPSVSGGYFFVEANTGATTITNFDDAQDGQEIPILFTTGNTTIQDNANIQLVGGANFVGSANDILKLKRVGTVFYEVSRSVN